MLFKSDPFGAKIINVDPLGTPVERVPSRNNMNKDQQVTHAFLLSERQQMVMEKLETKMEKSKHPSAGSTKSKQSTSKANYTIKNFIGRKISDSSRKTSEQSNDVCILSYLFYWIFIHIIFFIAGS